MLCMKGFRVRSFHKLLMSFRRNSWGLPKKSASKKRCNMRKKKEGRDRFKKQARETLKRSSEPESNVCMKKLSRWIKEQLILTWIGSLTIQLRGLQTDRPASWQTWESRRWTSICKATKEGSTTTKLSLEILFNRSCCQTFKEADCRRKYSFSREDSSKQQRNHCTQLSPKQQLSSWNKRRSDHPLFSFFVFSPVKNTL